MKNKSHIHLPSSFRRKPESRKRLKSWIPAFAGMTSRWIPAFAGMTALVLSTIAVAADVNIDAAWLSQHGPAPYVLDQSDTIYVLKTSITVDGTAFLLGSETTRATNVSLDLNGYTITYANMDFTGVQNPGFENGSSGWDLSHAPNASVLDYTQQLFFDDYSLRMESIGGAEEYVLSSPVNLPAAGKYAITAEVRGGPWDKVLATLTPDGINASCSNHVSGMHTTLQGTDMLWGVICEFDVTAPATIRAKIALTSADGTDTSLNVDEVDVRPIDDNSGTRSLGMAAIKPASWNSEMTEIKNGTIIEGRSKAVYSSAIISTGVRKIHDLKIYTNGLNSENIDETWSGGVEIYNNYLEANGKTALNRQYFFSMIDLGRTPGGNKIYNNILMNGPHVGICHGNAGNEDNPYRSEIYNNTIKTKINASNGFAIVVGSNLDIHDNIIQPIQGHGLGLGRGSNNVRIYNNLIEPRTWPGAEYSTYFYPNSCHGIRIKNYGSGTIKNLEIFNNTIIGKTTPQKPNCYTEVIGITNYLADDADGAISQDVRIHDNNISVETDDYLHQHAIAYNGQGQGEIYNNTFKSNHIIVELSGADDGGAANYKTFTSNTLVKSETPQAGFHTLRYGYFSPRDNTFIDTIVSNGADLKDIARGIYNDGGCNVEDPLTREANPLTHLHVAWSFKLHVRDPWGYGVSGAVVSAYDKNNNKVREFGTDANGELNTSIDEYTYLYDAKGSYINYSPYTITITKPGYDAYSQNLSFISPTELTVILNSPLPSGFIGLTRNVIHPDIGSEAAINLNLSEPKHVAIKVYGRDGFIKELADQDFPARMSQVSWDGTNSEGSKVASGIYIMIIKPDGEEPKKERVAVVR
ncbi:MAG: hypothetical protein LHV69_03610 [Elusimicrobia bacterium]|nr:hypothetical protein [Candidatus Obscuribacterium magneticum]